VKKLFVTILTTVFFVCSTCFAAIYFSPFGFSVSISSHWEIINSKKLLEDPKYEDYFNRIFGHFG
jgi:TRAP-type mannitol/chloroaromatic compound transport system permease small subunit